MAIKYPAQLDNSSNIPPAVDGTTFVSASLVNLIREAVLAVEAELGVKPSGTYTTVRARLDAMDITIANIVVGPGGTGGTSGTFSCLAGIAVNDAVYVNSDDNVVLADASDILLYPCVGIVEDKPTSTTATVKFYRRT